MSVMESLLINGSARQKLAMNGEGQVEGFRQHLAPQGRWLVATCGHPARGICSACSSPLVLLFALSGDSLVTSSSFSSGSSE